MSAVPPTTSTPTTSTEARKGLGIGRIVVIVSAVLIGLIVLIVALAVTFAAIGGASFAEVVRVIRDLVIIFLALEGILIILALAMLILQIARLVAIVQTDIRPILDNTQTTIKTAQGTVEFMSDHLLQPLIKTGSFLAGVSALFASVGGLLRSTRRPQPPNEGEGAST